MNHQPQITPEQRAAVVAALQSGARNRVAAEAGGVSVVTVQKIRRDDRLPSGINGRPPIGATKRIKIGLSLTLEEAARLDAARLDGEARATTAHRLIVVAL